MLKRFFPHVTMIALVAVLLVETACAVQPAAGTSTSRSPSIGQSIELSGKLTLRGNEPFVYPVVQDPGGVWQLDGLSAARASALQNQQVKIRGTVVRLDPAGMQLPMVHVESLTTP
ncbi:hypothetical protein [Paraburkholderia flava]|uniref:hypothetical protein n=1 Tax=Paraburkholderia flava TaxID=2547393 RepID=UPI00105EB3A2|nr:hypothetical protein [Paraburkholderia flava]